MAATRPPGEAGSAKVPAWDLPTRLFKWGLVLLVGLAWVSQRYGDLSLRWHRYNGYAILTLIVFRILWGLVGSSTARFSAWVSAPWTALRYAAATLTGRGRPYLGHNPLGAWMIIALLLLAGAQGIAGLFTADSNGLFGGPFAHTDPVDEATPLQATMSWYHFQGYWILLGFAALHILVNLTYQFAKRDPIITAMVTGEKPARDYADAPAMQRAPAEWLRAGACVAVALAIVLGGIKLAGGNLG